MCVWLNEPFAIFGDLLFGNRETQKKNKQKKLINQSSWLDIKKVEFSGKKRNNTKQKTDNSWSDIEKSEKQQNWIACVCITLALI